MLADMLDGRADTRPGLMFGFPAFYAAENRPHAPNAQTTYPAQSQARPGFAPMGGAGLEPATSCL